MLGSRLSSELEIVFLKSFGRGRTSVASQVGPRMHGAWRCFALETGLDDCLSKPALFRRTTPVLASFQVAALRHTCRVCGRGIT